MADVTLPRPSKAAKPFSKMLVQSALTVLGISIIARYLWWIGEMLGWVFDWCAWPTITKDWQFLAFANSILFMAEMTVATVRNLFEKTS